MLCIDATFVPKLSRRARLRFDRHSARTMIVYPERGLELNAPAAAIASRCDGSRSIAAIASELAAEHEGSSREQIEADVIAFIATLRDRALLEVP